MPVNTDHDEVQTWSEPRRVDLLPELAGAARPVRIVVANQWTVPGSELFKAILGSARSGEIYFAVTVYVQAVIHPKQGLISICIHVSQGLRSKQSDRFG